SQRPGKDLHQISSAGYKTEQPRREQPQYDGPNYKPARSSPLLLSNEVDQKQARVNLERAANRQGQSRGQPSILEIKIGSGREQEEQQDIHLTFNEVRTERHDREKYQDGHASGTEPRHPLQEIDREPEQNQIEQQPAALGRKRRQGRKWQDR